MDTEAFRASQRIKSFGEMVLVPRLFSSVHPLTVAVHQCDEHLTPDAARARPFTPADIGWRWGPIWSTAWFRLTGTIPEDLARRPLCLRFSSGTEALLWLDDTPFAGLGPNHDTIHLPGLAGRPLDLLVEAACNHPLGATMFFWDQPETHARWKERLPGRLERAELALRNEDAWALWHALEFTRGLIEESPDPAPLIAAAERTLALIDAHDPGPTAAAALDHLREALATLARASPTPGLCYTVGHAHIDTAWLWTIDETKRKCLRTFATALRLLERYPDFRFLCTSPQHYAWVRERSPALFDQIARRVREGRWEAIAAMWVEPDANLPSGESFIRQLQHGLRFLDETFPGVPRPRTLFLPDSFGFCASLPQIMRLAGLDTFITNKLWWNERTEFPFTHFRWRGIDGSEVLAHLTPGQDYNSANTARDLARATRANQRPGGPEPLDRPFLHPFGFGDGGGGPTEEMILRASLARAAPGLAPTTFSGTRAFESAFRDLAATAPFPTLSGELYLERHRGTYTTQARIKRGNARAEAALRRAEWLLAGARQPAPARLDHLWKTLLLNQFHDILPGSCIGPVARRAEEDHARLLAEADAISAAALAAWPRPSGDAPGRLVLNPTSHPRSGWIAGIFASDVPGMGAKWVPAIGDPPPPPATLTPTPDGYRLSNSALAALIDRLGRITSLRTPGGPELCAAPMNQLILCDDLPRAWEAWDIDEEHLASARPADAPATRTDARADHAAASITIERPIGRASRITQTITLSAGSPRLDIATRIDWRESRTLLRALFPSSIDAPSIACEIPFGFIERPTRTPPPDPKFEFPAHRWVHIADANAGLALLNDCKHGHSCRGGTIGLTLLRSPKFPDPDADMGEHEFTLSILPTPHRALAIAEGEAIADDLFSIPARGSPWSWAPVRLRGEARIAALYPAPDGLIVRIVERSARAGEVAVEWSFEPAMVRAVNLLDEPIDHPAVHHSGSATTARLRPFEILTLRADPPTR